MTDLEEAMWEGWGRVWPGLRDDPDELRARLSRRGSLMYRRPLRAFCLAVRASDHRINAATAAMVPEDADDPRSAAHPGWMVEHDLVLDKQLLVRICRPVRAEPPGIPADVLAKELGCSVGSVLALRRNGTLQTHRVKGLRGRRQQVPLVFTWDLLDPSAFGKCRPDPIWGALWEYHAEWLAEDFGQSLRRVPEYHRLEGREEFRGWRWICPACKQRVRTVYLPLKGPDWGEYVGLGKLAAEIGVQVEDDEAAEPMGCFACTRCHGVINFSRASLKKSWNQLVLHYSGGLLYGREVKRPAWLREGRKRAYAARETKATKREALERMLVGTELKLGQIAEEMGVKYCTVAAVAGQIYRRRGVRGRGELREVVGAR